MKKVIFNPCFDSYRLPKITSRRIFGTSRTGSFRTSCYKSDGDETSEDKRTKEELLLAIQSKIDKSLENRATKEELQKIKEEQDEAFKGISLEGLREMADEKTGVMATLAKQGLEIQRLRNEVASSEKPDMSTRGQIKAWLESKPKELGGERSVNDVITSMRNGGSKSELPALNIRVASPMTPTTVNSTGSPYIGRVEVESGITAIVRRKPVFWDYIIKGRTSAENYVWVNMTNPLGAAAWLAPGELKPGVSFEMDAENSHAKKIAVSSKAAMELLQDIDGMTTFIEQEMTYQLNDKVNSTLMSGAGDSKTPKGIQNYAVGYTRTDIFATNANNFDAIRASVAQLAYSWLAGDVTVFINPIDAANMDMTKTTEGMYILPPFSTADGKRIAGATIVEDRNIAVGYFLAAKLEYYKILIYQDFMLKWGWENDDFTRNLVTAIAEKRMHQFVKDVWADEGVFIYDNFTSVIAAITPAP